MTAAIYARKSTEQAGVSDDQKSVARQIEHARRYAEAKGWRVADEHVYVDDGISGAEFANRPGFVRLMNAVGPGRHGFDVLVMSEESRLGRESIETAYALKQLITGRVRVFFYLEDRERTIDSPADKLMMSVVAFADEMEREKARQRTYDALIRKARAGHVTGGRVFGYDNHELLTADGRRSHVERVINVAEAAVVRRIFDLCGQGYGLGRITRTLNDEGAASPRAQQGRPRSWAPSSVREVLHRTLYRGELTWNQSRKRDKWGRKAQHARPATDWLTVPMPELRVVTEESWTAAHARLETSRRSYLRGTGGRLWGSPGRATESKYLLPGLARCGVCGGSIYVKSRSHGRTRKHFYGCTSFHQRGRSMCSNGAELPMDCVDALVLDAIESRILAPEVIEQAIGLALARLRPALDELHAEETTLAQQRTAVETELLRLGQAVAAGGELTTLVDAMREREGVRKQIAEREAALSRRSRTGRMTDESLLEALRTRAKDWRALLRGHIPQARQIVKKLLLRPFRLEVREGGQQALVGAANPANLFGNEWAIMVASPTGFEPVF